VDEVRAWENVKLRRMFGMKRAPNEGRFEYNVRTSRKIAGWFETAGLPRLHRRLLQSVYRWAAVSQTWKLESGASPLRLVWNVRTKAVWQEQHQVWLLLDPRNKGGRRHRKPGSLLSWEQLMVDTAGLHWRFDAQDATTWRKGQPEWMAVACEQLHVQPRGLPKDKSGQHRVPRAATVILSIWRPGDLQEWSRQHNSFEIRLDSQLLARWLQADTRLEGSELGGRLDCVLVSIANVVSCGWAPRHPWSHWAIWVPREMNVLADAMANWSMDTGLSCAWINSSLQTKRWRGNAALFADGGYRHKAQKSAAGWACFQVLQGQPTLAACGSVVLDASKSDSFLAEL